MTDHEVTRILFRLRKHLKLDHVQLGMMFGVSEETARRWERGEKIPAEKLLKIKEAGEALEVLRRCFRKDRLKDVIRRNHARDHPFFKGRSALDLILQGKIVEVANDYHKRLAYQGYGGS